MTKPHFESTISLGSIITSLLGAAIVPFLWWTIQSNGTQDSRITALETAVKSITATLDAIERRNVDAAAELRTGMRRIDDKLSTMLIQNYRPGEIAPRR